MNTYQDSSGNLYTQTQINSKLSRERKSWLEKYVCECCNMNHATEADHTIAKARCKVLHKTELIWKETNISWSCRACHEQWERFKSGLFSYHNNAYERMLFTAIHDPENFKLRFLYITNVDLLNKLEVLYQETILEL